MFDPTDVRKELHSVGAAGYKATARNVKKSANITSDTKTRFDTGDAVVMLELDLYQNGMQVAPIPKAWFALFCIINQKSASLALPGLCEEW
jgi:hypothetical protein